MSRREAQVIFAEESQGLVDRQVPAILLRDGDSGALDGRGICLDDPCDV